MQSGERVGSDFGPGVRNGGQQGRFTGVGIADQADFSDDLQFEQEFTFLARFTRLGEAGGLTGSGGEVTIAQATAAAFAEDKTLAVLSEIDDQFAFGSRGRR